MRSMAQMLHQHYAFRSDSFCTLCVHFKLESSNFHISFWFGVSLGVIWCKFNIFGGRGLIFTNKHILIVYINKFMFILRSFRPFFQSWFLKSTQTKLTNKHGGREIQNNIVQKRLTCVKFIAGNFYFVHHYSFSSSVTVVYHIFRHCWQIGLFLLKIYVKNCSPVSEY